MIKVSGRSPLAAACFCRLLTVLCVRCRIDMIDEHARPRGGGMRWGCVSMDNPFCYLNIIQLSNHPTIQPKFEFLSWNFLYSFSEVIEI